MKPAVHGATFCRRFAMKQESSLSIMHIQEFMIINTTETCWEYNRMNYITNILRVPPYRRLYFRQIIGTSVESQPAPVGIPAAPGVSTMAQVVGSIVPFASPVSPAIAPNSTSLSPVDARA
jgi:hypothetical protein